MACLLAATGVEFVRQSLALADQQDQRLAAAAASGERRGNQAALAPYPWRDELHPGQPPRLYYAQADGRVLRAAALLRPGPQGEPVLVQVAEPATRRLAGLGELASGPLPAFTGGIAAMAALAALASTLAQRWLARALQQFDQGEAANAAPIELAATLGHMRALQEQQRQWVEEQRRFLADAAHQLRTPMAVLRTQLQTALADGADPKASLGAMLHTVDRATGLANQLLSLTRIQQLKRTGRMEPVAVAGAVREVVVELSPLLVQKRLDFALDGEGFDAPADAVMLGELLRNLLANAIHHSPRESRVGVVLRGPPFHEVVVWDEGPGVDDAVKPRLFTPFSAAQGGVGLGLSICQQIAEAMEAQVQLYNRVEAGGTVGVDAVIVWRPKP